MNKATRLPAYMVKKHGTTRAWKALKRRQLRAAIEAIDALFDGCAFTPCRGEIESADISLSEALIAMSVEQWGR